MKISIGVKVAVAAIIVMASSVWAWQKLTLRDYDESIANFNIPWSANILEKHYESSQFGADTLRITVYQLDDEYAKGLVRQCESFGYSVLNRKRAAADYPFANKYLVGNAPVCAKRTRGEALEISILQGRRLVILVNV